MFIDLVKKPLLYHMKKIFFVIFFYFVFLGCGDGGDDCCIFPPENTPETQVKDWDPRSDVEIEGSIFTVSYNEILQQPNWIRYDVRAIDKRYDRDGMRFYEVDSIITSDDNDYYDNEWDRGHLAPAAAFTDTYDNLYATFSFLNCTLQKDQLNRGEWAELETKIRGWANVNGTIAVEILLHFQEGHIVLPTGAHVPSGYTKSLTFPDGSQRCFYFPNTETTTSWESYEIDCSS